MPRCKIGTTRKWYGPKDRITMTEKIHWMLGLFIYLVCGSISRAFASGREAGSLGPCGGARKRVSGIVVARQNYRVHCFVPTLGITASGTFPASSISLPFSCRFATLRGGSSLVIAENWQYHRGYSYPKESHDHSSRVFTARIFEFKEIWLGVQNDHYPMVIYVYKM